jgi:hypothetical protein
MPYVVFGFGVSASLGLQQKSQNLTPKIKIPREFSLRF